MKLLKLRYSYCFLGLIAALNIANAQDTTDTVVEEVIPIAYGQQPRWLITGSQSHVAGEDLEKTFTSNLATSLYGRLGGLTVQQQGAEPGLESPVLLGRGVATFGPGRDVLVMVDGYESTFEHLSPYEIAYITLLKDASATAVYGTRGANGVLLVTTKRGDQGPLQLQFAVQSGVRNPLRMPAFLGSFDYARLHNEARENDGFEPLYSAAELDAYRTGADPYRHPDVDWYDEVLRTAAPATSYNLTFKGGSETVRYFGLLNLLTEQGLYIKSGDASENSKNSRLTRYNFRTNIDVDITKNMMASLTLSGTVEDKANPAANSTSSLFNTLAIIPPNAFPVYNPNGTYGGNALFSNPLGDVLETGHYTSNGRTLQSAFQLAHKLDMLTPGLKIGSSVAFNNFFRNYSNKLRQYERYLMADNGSDTDYIRFGERTSLVGDEGGSEQWRNVVFQAYLDYARDLGPHTLRGMLRYNLDNYALLGQQHPFKHLGFSGRFTYANQAKYIGEFSFGYLGSENFAKGRRFGFFPAVSAGWVLSEEAFLAQSHVVDFLKIRGSFGLTGNDRIAEDRFLFDNYYRYPASYYFGTDNNSSSSLQEGPAANPDISWEKDRMANIGFEAQLFGRLELMADWFTNRRYDILTSANRVLPDLYGIESPLLNRGVVRNRGVEVMANYRSDRRRPFQFSLKANFWYARNQVVEMAEDLVRYDYLQRVGHPIGQPFLLEALGLFQNDNDIANAPQQRFATVQPGDVRYKDQNQDQVINAEDYVASGYTNIPEITVGLNPTFAWKGFDASLFFQAVTNRTVYRSGHYYYAFQNDGKISEFALDRWTPQNAGSATYPRLSAVNNLNNFQPSSFWQVDGSFIKLRSAEVGYTIGADVLARWHVGALRIFANGTNLFSLDRVKYTDPETLTGYPAMRSVSLGLKLNF
ncbi:SusC/RagA family TonB-linked outer membrane protein [Parapedobacter sp. 10938]|uniref:SusC/RagA family TonB-linked outer membrane protein n=1 Tax=Parapedobacter flavus TaxID=3110225 RepID=UPI002DB607F8|nr:TonB-dependent receptor [Parapedobacter sp. 10938]MEC3879151.1 TonB-dependent receptor [Parapedobacter sp. 10938]